ncbi:hypothetical protein ABZ721_38155 [Streptomyces sp. NPDC006733]|uniref:hypothetical protein n=1 Tax=Streptomyces sp. NPDC006733 TaxID=3155460 RepID=UPI0033C6EC20
MTATGQALALVGALCATIAASALYLRRVAMPRPPVGRFTRSDIAVMAVVLMTLPLVYLHLPGTVVGVVFGTVFTAACGTGLAPLTGGRVAAATAVALGALVVASGLARWDPLHIVCGDLLLVLAVIAVTNLWAQTGMTAAQVAALAVVLAPYDLLATGLSSVTADLVRHVSGTPFTPLLTIAGGGSTIAAGLGDCLMLVLWPLVATKAYGRRAGWCGALAGLAVVGVVLHGAVTGWLHGGVPLLTPLGPCIGAQYLFWRSRHGTERRTRQWRGAADPAPAGRPASAWADALAAASRADRRTYPAGTWLAVDAGAVVGTGAFPGAARRAGREAGHPGPPVVIAVPPGDAP